MRSRLALLLLLVLAVITLAQVVPHAGMSYEEETPPNLVRFELHRAQGIVRDSIGNVIPNVGIGIFADTPAHPLAAMVVTGENGKFDFGKSLPDGNYRLVAKYPGLCTANIPIAVYRKVRNRQHLELRMEFPGLDVCSYAAVK